MATILTTWHKVEREEKLKRELGAAIQNLVAWAVDPLPANHQNLEIWDTMSFLDPYFKAGGDKAFFAGLGGQFTWDRERFGASFPEAYAAMVAVALGKQDPDTHQSLVDLLQRKLEHVCELLEIPPPRQEKSTGATARAAQADGLKGGPG